MKKIFCLVLVVLTVLALFTGCSGRAYSNYDSGRHSRDRQYRGNVSTSRDGTVNGGEGSGRNGNTGAKPHADMGIDMEIGK